MILWGEQVARLHPIERALMMLVYAPVAGWCVAWCIAEYITR